MSLESKIVQSKLVTNIDKKFFMNSKTNNCTENLNSTPVDIFGTNLTFVRFRIIIRKAIPKLNVRCHLFVFEVQL